MKTAWEDQVLDSLLSCVIDYRGKTPIKSDHGIRLVTAKIIKNGRILDDVNQEYIRPEIYEETMRRGIPKKEDVLITTEAPLGEVAIIKSDEKIALAQRVILLRANSEKIYPYFLYYSLQSPQVQHRIRAKATGTTVFGIKNPELRSVLIPTPNKQIQQKIASILSAYDDIINNNLKRIKLLEESAQLLYTEWFVNLRFPGYEHVKIVDGVPEGWREEALGEVCEIVMGQSPESQFYNEDEKGLPFHQGVTEFGDRFISHKKFCTKVTRIAEAGDILCSVRAPVGRLNITPEKIIIGRGLSAIRSKEGFQSFQFYQLKNHFFQEDMIGGGAIFASVTKKELCSQKMLIPSNLLVREFEEIVTPIDRQISNLYEQNNRLKSARDLLLPRLMDGTIEV